MSLPEYVVGTQEYLKAEVTNSVDLVAQPVFIKVAGSNHTAQWYGAAGPVRRCRTSTEVDFTSWTPGLYRLYVGFTDAPEDPLLDAGYISVVAAA